MLITNIALFFFWVSLLGSGITRIEVNSNQGSFYSFLEKCKPFFRLFAYSGVFIFIGISTLIVTTIVVLSSNKYKPEEMATQTTEKQLYPIL
jgi:hypothetical protein